MLAQHVAADPERCILIQSMAFDEEAEAEHEVFESFPPPVRNELGRQLVLRTVADIFHPAPVFGIRQYTHSSMKVDSLEVHLVESRLRRRVGNLIIKSTSH